MSHCADQSAAAQLGGPRTLALALADCSQPVECVLRALSAAVLAYRSEFQRKLSIIRGDVIRSALPFFDVCVANVPYNVRHRLLVSYLWVTRWGRGVRWKLDSCCSSCGGCQSSKKSC